MLDIPRPLMSLSLLHYILPITSPFCCSSHVTCPRLGYHISTSGIRISAQDPSPISISAHWLPDAGLDKQHQEHIPVTRFCTNLFGSNARLRGTSNKPGSAKSPVSPIDSGQLGLPSSSLHQGSQSSSNLASKLPPLPASPSLAQSIGGAMGTAEEALIAYQLPRPLPIWLNPAYARHIVKGNFMTLSAKPKTVEEGEWVAHHGMLPPCPPSCCVPYDCRSFLLTQRASR